MLAVKRVMQVSVNGVTGSIQNVNPRVEHLLQEIKQVTDKAVCVGFGISTPDHVRQVIKLSFYHAYMFVPSKFPSQRLQILKKM